MSEFPRATSLHRSGAPFITLWAAMEYARSRAALMGVRQRVSLRSVSARPLGSHMPRWVVRSVTEAWEAGDRGWYSETGRRAEKLDVVP